MEAAQSVEAYLAAVPEPARSTLVKMRATIRSVAGPEATEAISYGMPSFRYKGALVGYAAFTNHCSFFPMNSALIDQFGEELAGYSTLRDDPLPAGQAPARPAGEEDGPRPHGGERAKKTR